MPQKKEGATMECQNCGADLICRKKDYGGGYEPTLQWQNFDGTAHYSTKDGKNFTCSIPDDDETAQTRIPTDAATIHVTDLGATTTTTPGNPSKSISPAEFALLRNIDEKLDVVLSEIGRVREFVEPVFLKMVDDQIKRGES